MSLIVGDPTDPHVEAVVHELKHEPVIIDAATILTTPVTITSQDIRIGRKPVTEGPGWLRRLAPAGWAETITAPGVEAASRSAAVSALAAIARDERFSWLTPLDALGGSENKPYQYRRAAEAGVAVPPWVVTTDPSAVPQAGKWVAKTLGPGSFIDDTGCGHVVPTTAIDTSDRDTVARVPFILQHRIDARAHARVITVGGKAWSATLPARDLPLDWRLAPEGHHGFTPTPAPDHVHRQALAINQVTSVGYSAQDWIQDSNRKWWFIDLNPAGQWLFLPEPVAGPATLAIAHHLDGSQ